MNPKQQGYFMPPEWSEHERTFISWPIQESMVYPEDYHEVSKGYIELVEAISEFEKVTVIVNENHIKEVKSKFANIEGNIEFLSIEHNDAWLRDNGPTFLLHDNGERAGVNWKFNAWGEKYAPWDLDDEVAPKILDHLGIKRFDAPLVMEGGSFHVDGEGTLLTTEECLLNPNRNPELTKEQIEQFLKDYLNIEKVIWLKDGLSGDETDGHVDNIACFGSPGKIIMQVCHDKEDENYEITQENLSILTRETDARGRKFEVIQIEQPPKEMFKGNRLTLSYLNFYFVNDGVILPVFGGAAQKNDQLAESELKKTFPERRIRKINGMSIIKEGGNVHCTTQQLPTAIKVK
ncbi:agmatine deiminase family protein [Evansella sp. AB-P1]|uniref:agmatine deiminase family protein n=1 Tax=Evansella sp. AB-P1 TaxID=3037653 RepID=UPI00241DE552|nr:agmatine deiminase family protein [Evansella sp. AB-P1]MDG5790048.1 agmatine deiminase family protein [Evansella sp. AB-P1]